MRFYTGNNPTILHTPLEKFYVICDVAIFKSSASVEVFLAQKRTKDNCSRSSASFPYLKCVITRVVLPKGNDVLTV